MRKVSRTPTGLGSNLVLSAFSFVGIVSTHVIYVDLCPSFLNSATQMIVDNGNKILDDVNHD